MEEVGLLHHVEDVDIIFAYACTIIEDSRMEKQEDILGKDLETEQEMVAHQEAVEVHQVMDHVQDVDKIHVSAAVIADSIRASVRGSAYIAIRILAPVRMRTGSITVEIHGIRKPRG